MIKVLYNALLQRYLNSYDSKDLVRRINIKIVNRLRKLNLLLCILLLLLSVYTACYFGVCPFFYRITLIFSVMITIQTITVYKAKLLVHANIAIIMLFYVLVITLFDQVNIIFSINSNSPDYQTKSELVRVLLIITNKIAFFCLSIMIYSNLLIYHLKLLCFCIMVDLYCQSSDFCFFLINLLLTSSMTLLLFYFDKLIQDKTKVQENLTKQKAFYLNIIDKINCSLFLISCNTNKLEMINENAVFLLDCFNEMNSLSRASLGIFKRTPSKVSILHKTTRKNPIAT